MKGKLQKTLTSRGRLQNTLTSRSRLQKLVYSVCLMTLLTMPLQLKANITYDIRVDGIMNSGEIVDKQSYYYRSNKDRLQNACQLDSGKYGKINCGPTCIKMIASYYGKKASEQEMNRWRKPTDLGYSQLDIKYFLEKYGITYQLGTPYCRTNSELDGSNLLKALDDGNILILAINTKSIAINENPGENDFYGKWGRTYSGKFNHYIVTTGYIVINDEIYLQISDPLEKNTKQDRFYRLSEVVKAIANNWNGYFAFK